MYHVGTRPHELGAFAAKHTETHRADLVERAGEGTRPHNDLFMNFRFANAWMPKTRAHCWLGAGPLPVRRAGADPLTALGFRLRFPSSANNVNVWGCQPELARRTVQVNLCDQSPAQLFPQLLQVGAAQVCAAARQEGSVHRRRTTGPVRNDAEWWGGPGSTGKLAPDSWGPSGEG